MREEVLTQSFALPDSRLVARLAAMVHVPAAMARAAKESSPVTTFESHQADWTATFDDLVHVTIDLQKNLWTWLHLNCLIEDTIRMAYIKWHGFMVANSGLLCTCVKIALPAISSSI